MKSIAQIAAAMYEAYCAQAQAIDEEGLSVHALTWAALDTGTRTCWVAAANRARDEIQNCH